MRGRSEKKGIVGSPLLLFEPDGNRGWGNVLQAEVKRKSTGIRGRNVLVFLSNREDLEQNYLV